MNQESKIFNKDMSFGLKGIAILMMMMHHMYRTADRFSGFSVNLYPLQEQSIIRIADTWFHNLAMRFVVGGLFLRQHGVAFIGNVLHTNELQFVRVNNEFIEVRILDSSFATYLLMRGAFWMAYTLAWLCVGMWKALKKRDYAIPFLCAIILIFAMVERPGLEMWFNFIMLYPLAKVVSKEGTVQVLEFTTNQTIDEPVIFNKTHGL